MRSGWIVSVAVGAVLWLVGASSAPVAASAATAGKPPVATIAFKLKASDGYSIFAYGVASHDSHPATLILFVQRPGAFVTYSFPAQVTEDGVRADLGELGEIAVSFHPSDEVRRERSSCGGKLAIFKAGFYEGQINFTGEEGYTEVNAVRAPLDIRFLLDLLCPGSGWSSGGPGAMLRARQQLDDGSETSFEAIKNGPAARVSLVAGIRERRGAVRIERAIDARAKAAAFAYDPMLRDATVALPPPFSGSATFRRGSGGSNSWSGDLAVDFPGHSDVSLARAPLKATLTHAHGVLFGSN
jgi:hypothetical protein